MKSWAPLLSLLLLTGCGEESDGGSAPAAGPTGVDTPPCEPEPIVDVEPDEVTASGFSAQDILGLATAAPAATMKYDVGGSAEVTFAVELAPPARYSASCAILYVPTRLSVTTSDAAWALDAAAISLVAAGPNLASAVFAGTPSDIGLDLAAFGVAGHESYQVRINFAFGMAQAFGNLIVIGQDPNQPDTKYRIGSF